MMGASDPILSAIDSVKLLDNTQDDDAIERSFDNLLDPSGIVAILECLTLIIPIDSKKATALAHARKVQMARKSMSFIVVDK
jgi:hypothetical protein